MNVGCSVEEFIRDYSKEIINSNAALFIGSGLSRAAGYTDWKGMLKEVAQDIGLDVNKETDLISLAEYYVNSKRSREKINKAISEFFSVEHAPTETHRILASLPITSYWTTNYDKLMERTFKEQDISYSFLTNDKSFQKFVNGSGVVLHKLHGDVDSPGEAVITRLDYEEFAFRHEMLLAKLKGEMCSKSFLFLGYSFSDTDIMHILTRIRLFYKDNKAKTHYCILEKLARKKDEQGKLESDEDFAYRQTKQEHHILDLKSYGISTVLVDNYKTDIPAILNEIRRRVYIRDVFISGACESNNESIATYSQYAQTISAWLVTENFKIHCGYGKNIGADVVAGADDGCRLSKPHSLKKLNSCLYIYPFPYKASLSEIEREKVYDEYRQRIISKTGICIIINGTKLKNRKIQNSVGILNEAKIAMQNGCLVIPIAVTGGAAKQIWDEMNQQNTALTISTNFQKLNSGQSFEEVFSAVKLLLNDYINQ